MLLATKKPAESGTWRVFRVFLVAGAGLALKLQHWQVENKAGLIGCFDALFSACA